MKKLFVLSILTLWALGGCAKTHTVTLTWQTDSTDAGGTVTVYRSNGACGGSEQNFKLLKSGVPLAGPYIDSGLTSGSYCYYVEVVLGTASAASKKPITVIVP